MRPYPLDSIICKKMRPGKDQEVVLEKYLVKTTLFWNAMVHHLKPATEKYVTSPCTEEADFDFLSDAHGVYELIVKSETPSTGVSPSWLPYLAQIRELPENLLLNRFVDLVAAYSRAKRSRHDVNCVDADFPQRKTEFSGESVQFDEGDFEIEDRKLKISSIYPFSVDLDTEIQLDPEVNYSLSVSRRKVQPSNKSRYGPEDEDNTVYTFTFKKA